jgi:predicted nucleic acid-binding Zn ribbon protein
MSWGPVPEDTDRISVVGDSLEVLVKRLGGGSAKIQSAVLGAWDHAVGPEVASHARPIALVDGVLTVEVDDAPWLTQLKWLGGRMCDRLNEATNSTAVERLNVRLNVRLSRPKASKESP